MESEIKQGTLADFCKAHGVECQAISLAARPDRAATEWDSDASHWQVILSVYEIGESGLPKNETKRCISCLYSMGSAHKHTPKASELLWSLLMDAADIKAGFGFEEWADNLGYDADSRKAKRIFKACKRVHKDLAAFLGDLYDTAADLAAEE